MSVADIHSPLDLAATIPAQRHRAVAAPRGLHRAAIIGIAAAFVGIVIVLPLGAVLVEAFRAGLPVVLAALAAPDAIAAFKLTTITALIVLPLNVLFGIAAAWSIAKFEWRGKTILTTLIDLPFTVSPVIAGMAFVLLLGSRGWLGPTLDSLGIKVIFAVPGIILATAFVTIPFVARELIPLMEAQTRQEEEAALALGASGWRTFLRITLPNIRWGLLFGCILCAARAIGEFGAVSVVSGHIRGQTETVPLHVESLYGEYRFGAAAALATVLIGFTVLTVVLRHILQSRHPGARLAH